MHGQHVSRSGALSLKQALLFFRIFFLLAPSAGSTESSLCRAGHCVLHELPRHPPTSFAARWEDASSRRDEYCHGLVCFSACSPSVFPRTTLPMLIHTPSSVSFLQSPHLSVILFILFCFPASVITPCGCFKRDFLEFYVFVVRFIYTANTWPR